jgi:hypothetical protein
MEHHDGGGQIPTDLPTDLWHHDSAFVDAFRAGAERLKAAAAQFADMFPLSSFPPALPFNAPA